jgi:hypothetical protein
LSAGPYTKTGRLSDVLALIQVLALDPDTSRSEDGIGKELQGPPSSASSWYVLAKEHREFFRVAEHEHGLSLVARYVLPKTGDKRPSLAPDFVGALLQTAITIHDRQREAKEWWKSLIPLWSALIGGVFGTASALITLYFNSFRK